MALVTRTVNPLHFEDLEPHRFEDLVRQLIYDFRNWSRLEALGRSGNDDGIDIRGVEAVEDDIEAEDENVSTIDTKQAVKEKIWTIQCKRYSKLSPNQVEKILEDYLEN